MLEPNITYHIIEDEVEVPTKDYYAGSYESLEEMHLRILIWNNKWGADTVKTATNCILKVGFSNIEDSILLERLELEEDSTNKDITIRNNVAITPLSKKLYGNKYDTNANNNSSNHVTIDLYLPIIDGLKKSIKSLYIDIEYDSEGSGL